MTQLCHFIPPCPEHQSCTPTSSVAICKKAHVWWNQKNNLWISSIVCWQYTFKLETGGLCLWHQTCYSNCTHWCHTYIKCYILWLFMEAVEVQILYISRSNNTTQLKMIIWWCQLSLLYLLLGCFFISNCDLMSKAVSLWVTLWAWSESINGT